MILFSPGPTQYQRNVVSGIAGCSMSDSFQMREVTNWGEMTRVLQNSKKEIQITHIFFTSLAAFKQLKIFLWYWLVVIYATIPTTVIVCFQICCLLSVQWTWIFYLIRKVLVITVCGLEPAAPPKINPNQTTAFPPHLSTKKTNNKKKAPLHWWYLKHLEMTETHTEADMLFTFSIQNLRENSH